MAGELARESAPGPAFISGWATSNSVTNRAQEAHYFDKGLSLCARWTATTLDRPAAPGARRCSACMERLRDG